MPPPATVRVTPFEFSRIVSDRRYAYNKTISPGPGMSPFELFHSMGAPGFSAFVTRRKLRRSKTGRAPRPIERRETA